MEHVSTFVQQRLYRTNHILVIVSTCHQMAANSELNHAVLCSTHIMLFVVLVIKQIKHAQKKCYGRYKLNTIMNLTLSY